MDRSRRQSGAILPSREVVERLLRSLVTGSDLSQSAITRNAWSRLPNRCSNTQLAFKLPCVRDHVLVLQHELAHLRTQLPHLTQRGLEERSGDEADARELGPLVQSLQVFPSVDGFERHLYHCSKRVSVAWSPPWSVSGFPRLTVRPFANSAAASARPRCSTTTASSRSCDFRVGSATKSLRLYEATRSIRLQWPGPAIAPTRIVRRRAAGDCLDQFKGHNADSVSYSGRCLRISRLVLGRVVTAGQLFAGCAHHDLALLLLDRYLDAMTRSAQGSPSDGTGPPRFWSAWAALKAKQRRRSAGTSRPGPCGTGAVRAR